MPHFSHRLQRLQRNFVRVYGAKDAAAKKNVAIVERLAQYPTNFNFFIPAIY